VTGYSLDDWGSVPGEKEHFSLCHSIMTDFGSHPTSYPVITSGSFLENKQLDHEANCKGLEYMSYTSTPPV
jgi:hypothetical protein